MYPKDTALLIALAAVVALGVLAPLATCLAIWWCANWERVRAADQIGFNIRAYPGALPPYFFLLRARSMSLGKIAAIKSVALARLNFCEI